MGVDPVDGSCGKDDIENCVAADGELGITTAVVSGASTVLVSVEGVLGSELPML